VALWGLASKPTVGSPVPDNDPIGDHVGSGFDNAAPRDAPKDNRTLGQVPSDAIAPKDGIVEPKKFGLVIATGNIGPNSEALTLATSQLIQEVSPTHGGGFMGGLGLADQHDLGWRRWIM
jgi:hypothetical protein